MRSRSIIKKFILPWKGLLGFGVIIAIIGGIQWGVHAAIVSNTVTARDVVCTARAYDSTKVRVVMKLDCSGSEDEAEDPKFISAYLQKPGAFTCTRYIWAYATCKLQGEAKPDK